VALASMSALLVVYDSLRADEWERAFEERAQRAECGFLILFEHSCQVRAGA
jgi:hypothetical protein